MKATKLPSDLWMVQLVWQNNYNGGGTSIIGLYQREAIARKRDAEMRRIWSPQPERAQVQLLRAPLQWEVAA